MKSFPFWLRVLLAGILTLPLLALVIAFLPGIVLWPVYPDSRRKWLLELIPHLVEWVRALFGDRHDDDDA
ncbi:MAG: hypothetical protein JWQ95_1648 [Sphaerisporangium sp.]|jgi:hypothetical protein|nr:hypothetical protein [Sphaerisporangium sp.]